MQSAAHQADQYYYGVMQALVVDNKDPLGEGRVRLTYPWLNQSMETEWCRVLQLYAGNGYGSFFVPEEKDEVLVACVHGDLNEAIVLGGLYNGKDKPASKREESPARDEKLFRTKGEHQLLFVDTDDKKKIELKSSDSQSVTLDDQGKKLVVDTGGGQSITLDKNGGSITISTKGGQEIKLDGSGSITISGKMSIKLDASTVDIGSSATEPAMLGTTFLSLFSSHTHQVGPVPTTPPVPNPALATALSKTVKVQS
jgi:phage baseplate assembly protein V